MPFCQFEGSFNKSPAGSKNNADEESNKLRSMMHPGVSEANSLDYDFLPDKVEQ